MKPSIAANIATIQAISAVPTILQIVAEMTGLRFVCVAHVTEESWTTCAVLDGLDFGLKPGDQLVVTTTLCHEVRASDKAIIIDEVSKSPLYANHHTPQMYGFESYFSIPLYRPDGSYFGTLCGLDPLPASLTDDRTVHTMTLFAELISRQLENERNHEDNRTALFDAQETAELREQFIAVLGHDLRTPLSSIVSGADLLSRQSLDTPVRKIVDRIRRSGQRMSGLIDDMMDFARGRMGGGIPLQLTAVDNLATDIRHVIGELQSSHPDRAIQSEVDVQDAIFCDRGRIAQLLSNLLSNALIHGDAEHPVHVRVHGRDGTLELQVINTGTPIDAAIIPMLFQPYRRGMTKDRDGLGLGLYISAEIARSHHGRIDIASDADSTSFTFRMPATPPPAAAQKPALTSS